MPDTINGQYAELARLLLARQGAILGGFDTSMQNFGEQVLDSPGDIGDVAAVDASADYFLQLEDRYRLELIEIHDALDRMRDGKFGICVHCGERIEIARLRSLPYARFCTDCQHSTESRIASPRPAAAPAPGLKGKD